MKLINGNHDGLIIECTSRIFEVINDDGTFSIYLKQESGDYLYSHDRESIVEGLND